MGLNGRAPDNLAGMLVDRAGQHPEHRLAVAGPGQAGDLDAASVPTRLADVVDLAARLAATFAETGIRPGSRVALIGHTTPSYLLSWVALQLAGAEVALVNPAYPAELLAELLRPLDPGAVLWVGRDVERRVAPRALHLDVGDAPAGPRSGTEVLPLASTGALPGLSRRPLDTAGWMHTSGTTGVPKLCTQTHEYFLRLGSTPAISAGPTSGATSSSSSARRRRSGSGASTSRSGSSRSGCGPSTASTTSRCGAATATWSTTRPSCTSARRRSPSRP